MIGTANPHKSETSGDTRGGEGWVNHCYNKHWQNNFIEPIQGAPEDVYEMFNVAKEWGKTNAGLSVSINPSKNCADEDFILARDILGKLIGFDPALAVVVRHGKGRFENDKENLADVHEHLFIPYVNPENGKNYFRDNHTFAKVEGMARAFELITGEELTSGKFNILAFEEILKNKDVSDMLMPHLTEDKLQEIYNFLDISDGLRPQSDMSSAHRSVADRIEFNIKSFKAPLKDMETVTEVAEYLQRAIDDGLISLKYEAKKTLVVANGQKGKGSVLNINRACPFKLSPEGWEAVMKATAKREVIDHTPYETPPKPLPPEKIDALMARREVIAEQLRQRFNEYNLNNNNNEKDLDSERDITNGIEERERINDTDTTASFGGKETVKEEPTQSAGAAAEGTGPTEEEAQSIDGDAEFNPESSAGTSSTSSDRRSTGSDTRVGRPDGEVHQDIRRGPSARDKIDGQSLGGLDSEPTNNEQQDRHDARADEFSNRELKRVNALVVRKLAELYSKLKLRKLINKNLRNKTKFRTAVSKLATVIRKFRGNNDAIIVPQISEYIDRIEKPNFKKKYTLTTADRLVLAELNKRTREQMVNEWDRYSLVSENVLLQMQTDGTIDRIDGRLKVEEVIQRPKDEDTNNSRGMRY